MNDFVKGFGMPDEREHSRAGFAKRVVAGAYPFALVETAGVLRNKAPVNQTITAASATVTLERDKFYRIVATVDCYIAISNSIGLAALTTDVLLIAKEVMVISTWGNALTQIAVIGTSGTLQIVELG